MDFRERKGTGYGLKREEGCRVWTLERERVQGMTFRKRSTGYGP